MKYAVTHVPCEEQVIFVSILNFHSVLSLLRPRTFSILKNSKVHTTAITIKAKINYNVGITFRVIFYFFLADE